MKKRNKNFKTLSLKHIRTYVVATIMTTFAMDAAAHISFEEPSPDPVISEFLKENAYEGVNFNTFLPVSYEAVIESELNLESWMTTPFEIPVDEGSATIAFDPTSYEMAIETELNLEDWMTKPFEAPVNEGPAFENEYCSLGP